MLRVHAQVGGEIAQAVDHRLAVDELGTLEDVGMVPEDGVGAGRDGGTCDIPLVVGDDRR